MIKRRSQNEFSEEMDNDIKGNSSVSDDDENFRPHRRRFSMTEDKRDDEDINSLFSDDIDTSYREKDRFRDEPRPSFSRNRDIDEGDSLEDIGEDIASTIKPEKEGLFAKIAMILAGSFLLKKLLSSDAVKGIVGKFFPGKGVGEGEKETKQVEKRNPMVTFIAILIGIAMLVFIFVMSFYYLMRIGATDAGLGDGLARIMNGDELDGQIIEIDKITIDTYRTQYTKIDDNKISVRLKDKSNVEVEYKSTKDKGYIELKIETNETKGTVNYEVVKEY